MPNSVVDAVVEYTQLEARVGGYEAFEQSSESLNSIYDLIADLIGCQSKEIAILENATVGWCHAFYALPLSAGDRILTCEAEYAVNYVAFLQRKKRDGIVIDIVPSDENGVIDISALEKMIDDDVALIATTWLLTNGGLVNLAKEIGVSEPSSTRLDAETRGLPILLRAAPHYYNTEEEIYQLSNALKDCLK